MDGVTGMALAKRFLWRYVCREEKLFVNCAKKKICVGLDVSGRWYVVGGETLARYRLQELMD